MIGPVIIRELRLTARRPATYISRMVIGLIGGVLIITALGLESRLQLANHAGLIFFSVLVALGYCWSLFFPLFHAADSISREKREGTLGLLLLTDLSAEDVILGKLFSYLVPEILLLMAAIPLTSLFFLSGGLSPSMLVECALSIFNCLFFGLSLAMMVSCFCRKSTTALMLSLGGMLFFGVFLAALGLEGNALQLPVLKWMGLLSPGTALLGTLYPGLIGIGFGPAFMATHLLAWLFIWVGGVALLRTWQDEKSISATRLKRVWIPVRDLNPAYWLTCTRAHKPKFLLPAIIVAILASLGFGWMQIPVTERIPFWVVSFFLIQAAVKFCMASEACHRLSEDRKTGALELILTSPLSVTELLRGFLQGWERRFLGENWAILAGGLLMAFSVAVTSTRWEDRTTWAIWILLASLIWWVESRSLFWTGLWHGLNTADDNRSSGDTLSRVLGLPWVYFIGFVPLALLLRSYLPQWLIFLMGAILWASIVFVNSCYWIRRCRHRLMAEIRELSSAPLGLALSGKHWLVKDLNWKN